MSKFHEHLDKCVQCRESPFALCLIGQRLIKESSSSIIDRRKAEYLDPRPLPYRNGQKGTP